jgi:hypothetical protein
MCTASVQFLLHQVRGRSTNSLYKSRKKGMTKGRLTREERTTNICKLAVLEDEKAFAPCNLSQCVGSPVGPVGDNVAVGLEKADVVADVLGQLE